MEQVQCSQKTNGRDAKAFGENHQGVLFIVAALRRNYPGSYVCVLFDFFRLKHDEHLFISCSPLLGTFIVVKGAALRIPMGS
jgi:hypothetical protein